MISNDNNIQFSQEEKIDLLNRLGRFENFFEILFPGKKLSDEMTINDLIVEISTNPLSHGELMLLRKQVDVFLNFGEISLALK